MSLPVIDLSRARTSSDVDAVAAEIDIACRDAGFFYVVGHGVSTELQTRVEELAREFFAMAEHDKSDIAMRHGGRAWRGWFPLDGELTSGVPDNKEGLYFGEELSANDPRVRAGLPLHGANLFPRRPAGLRDAVLEYMAAVTDVGHLLLARISRALGLDDRWFDRNLTASPTVLFRIFQYPPLRDTSERWASERWASERWSVGEHTDYGLLTILAQDATGGLEVRSPDGWVAAPPIADAFVVNLGDMLERMTAGRYRSTPHRVRNISARQRVSFPLFLDPAWDADVLPVPNASWDAEPETDGLARRWDGLNVHDWAGTYGDYLLAKVAKVFPALIGDVMPTS
ncbi:MAG: isopenicillin N synthase family dioxygenase [Acidimicrobiia bacterium]